MSEVLARGLREVDEELDGELNRNFDTHPEEIIVGSADAPGRECHLAEFHRTLTISLASSVCQFVQSSLMFWCHDPC